MSTNVSDKCHVCNTERHTHTECSFIAEVIRFNESVNFPEQDPYQQQQTIQRARALRKVREENEE